jgi:hypothetical protein
MGNYKTFLVSSGVGTTLTLSELFYTNADYWGALPVLNLGQASEINEVSVADFGPFYVVCTLGQDQFAHTVRRMFVRDLSVALGYAFQSFVSYANPICGVCCNHKGQFVGGNIDENASGSWQGLTSRSVLWSALGVFDLDPQNTVEAGATEIMTHFPVKQNVQVYKLAPFGDAMLCYTDNSIVVLTPAVVNNVFTYGQTKLLPLGIRSTNHVAGDDKTQGFIDLRGDFWQIMPNQQPVRRGYREWIRPILDYTHATNDYRTIVSYVPFEKNFYISNGNTCLVINAYGAYTTNQIVASAVQSTGNTMHATYIDGTDAEARITTDALDFGSRGIKSVEAILADTSHPSTAMMTLSVEYRNTKSQSFSSRPWIPAGPIGRAVVRTAALDFRLRTRFTSFVDVELMGLMANVKYSDQRFKRGTVPTQYEVGTP